MSGHWDDKEIGTGMTPTHAHFVILACDQKKHRPQVSATFMTSL
ncbi:hypothetical protein [Wolbachia endosymbiont (group A) of Anomoia purmunda]|nr:hypothetical protein [Wolbachia endosymbiont (group A) of Anomoia purmunda]